MNPFYYSSRLLMQRKLNCMHFSLRTVGLINILFVSMAALSAQNSNTQIHLWQKDQLVIPEYDYVEKYDSTDIVRIQKVTDPFMEVYLPARKNRSDIGVLICPGGGYGILAWNWEGQDFAKRLNAAGITAFVLKYRLPFPVNGETDDTMPM